MSVMQRYRVNYRLLIGLVVGFLVMAPAAYGLWRFQVGRNADQLLGKAEAAEKSGNAAERFESLQLFMKLRPNDEEALVKYGEAAAALFDEGQDLSEVDPQTIQDAYYALVDAVLRTEDQKLRRKLVDVHLMFRAPDRALQTINELPDAGKGDPELCALKAQCLFLAQRGAEAIKWSYDVIGYDPQADTFDAAKAEAKEEPSIYFMLAQHLMSTGQPEIAKKIMDQMIVANPESRDAYVFQYQFLRATDDVEGARAALDKAYEIDPKDGSVLLAKGIEAQGDYQEALTAAETDEERAEADKLLDTAAGFFNRGLEEYPDRLQFYEYAARVLMFREKYDEAIRIVDQALEKFPLKKFKSAAGMPVAMDLEMLRIELLFAQQKLDAVKEEIKALRALDNSKVVPLADYTAARIELVNQNWLVAAQMFNDVKGRLITSTTMQAAASASQGMCHAQLGQWDLAKAAYQWALEKNPEMPAALAGLEEVYTHLGRDAGDNAGDTPLQFDEVVRQMLALPADQQDWEEVDDQIAKYVRRQAEMRRASESWVESRVELLRAQTLITRASATSDSEDKVRLFGEARKAIVAAHAKEPNDPTIQLAAPRVLMLEPGSGPAKALKLLDSIMAKNKERGVEETVPFRLLRVDLIFALNDEQVVNQLHAQTEGMGDWPPQQQAQVWAAVATRFEQLGKLPDATLCLQKAAELNPGLLPYRVALFELARKQADDDAMRAAQEKILELVKSKTDPDYVLTEVKRLMVAFGSNAITKDEFKQARALLDAAITLRPTWAELYVLSGQLALMLEEDSAFALKALDLALENGPTNTNALNLQIRLLSELGRFAEARQRMEKIPPESWSALLDRTAANVLRNVGELDQAVIEARKVADANAKDPSTQVWFAEIARMAKQTDAAETALKTAIELRPSDPDLWSALLNFYMLEQKADDVENTLRQAQLELDEEYLTLLTAQQHRLFGRFAQAESIMKSAYADRVDDPAVAQRLAEFYLAWGEQDDAVRQAAAQRGTAAKDLPPEGQAHRGQAAPYLNRILRAANDGKLPQTDASVAWARRQAARLFSLSGDYQDSLKAEELLSAAMESNAATPEGQDLLVEILTRRGDPASRTRIVEVLRQIQQTRGLPADRELLLGKALNDIGDWEAAQQQIEEAINRHPDEAGLRVGYVELLIDRKDFDQAERWLSRLSNLPAAAQAIPQLTVRLAAAQGDKEKVRQLLQAMTPDLRVLNPQQLQIVHAVGLLAESVGDHEYALNLITEYSKRVPGNDAELAQFTAMYGDLDAGLQMLSRVFETANMDQTLSTAIEVLRNRRDEDPVKVDAAINRLVSKARNDDPEAARRMVLEAESLEVQERFDDAIAAYGAILARDDVPKFVRATAINNLAFLLAMKKQDLDRALEGVNEAIEIIGPISDILDTRALVHLHKGDFASAVKDLRLAVKMGATGSKYFHLTEALLGAGDEAGALEAWEQAEARGVSADSVPVLEQQDFAQTLQKIEALRAKSNL
jgi:cellulose synthase operon protein C